VAGRGDRGDAVGEDVPDAGVEVVERGHLGPDPAIADAGVHQDDSAGQADDPGLDRAPVPVRRRFVELRREAGPGGGRCLGEQPAGRRRRGTSAAVRARDRGETGPTEQEILEHVVSPIIYAILFDHREIPSSYADTLVDRLLAAAC
jgi:hypothetical protein